MKKTINKTQGITLIALVITIVILIILAGVLVNLTLGENGLFTRTKLAKIRYEYAAAKEIVDVKLVDIQAECMTEGEEYTLDIIADRIGDEEEISTDIIHFYATAKNKSDNERPTGIKRIKGILVSANQYPQFKFLIGEAGNVIKVIGITTEDVQTTWTTGDLPAGFKTIEKFEEEIGVNAVSANQGGQEGTTYTITYNANGGSGTIESQTGTTLTVAGGNSLTPPNGQVFKGWNTASDGSGTSYNAGSQITLSADTTLYAQWRSPIIPGQTEPIPTTPEALKASYGTTTNFKSVEQPTDANAADYATKLALYNIDWKLFYDDVNYVYLIASDYVPNNLLPANGNTVNGTTYTTTDLLKTSGKNGSYNAAFCSNNDYNDYVLSTSNTNYYLYLNNASNDNAILKKNTEKSYGITSSYLHWVGLNFTSNNANIRATAFMMDTSKWSQFAGNTSGAFAIGGPTIEMFNLSWNAAHGSDKQLPTYTMTTESGNSNDPDWNTNGYKVGKPGKAGWFDYGDSNDLGSSINMWCIHEDEKSLRCVAGFAVVLRRRTCVQCDPQRRFEP